MYILHEVFQYSLPLSKSLQTENIDLADAMENANDVLEILKEMRSNADEKFAELFKSVEILCTEIDISIQMPRIVQRQTMRANVSSNTPEEYFRRTVFVPFLDSFIGQLEQRFTAHQGVLGKFQILIPKKASGALVFKKEDGIAISNLAENYSMFLGNTTAAIRGELAIWFKKLERLEKIPRNAVDSLAECNIDIMPGIHKLLQIMATLPVSSCSSERSFSTLRRLKTYLRNSTGENRLNGLALLNIHQEVQVTPDEILNEMAKMPRRVALV